MHWQRTCLLAALLLGPLAVQSPIPAEAGDAGAPPKQVLVVNTGDGTVSVVDVKIMKEVARHKVGPRPYGIAVSLDNKTVAVGVEDEEEVKFFTFPDFKPKGEFRVGKMFNDHIVLTKDGKDVMVANFYSDDVVAINMETMKESWRIKGLSAPHVVRYGPLNKLAYVTCKKASGVAIIDPEARKLVKFVPLTINPRSLTFLPDESKFYFGSHWTNAFFEADPKLGKVTRMLEQAPPKDNAEPREVTYHGVQAVYGGIILAANEGRSYVDAVEATSNKLLDRFTGASKPCCIEPVPGHTRPMRVMFSNIGDGSLQFVDVSPEGKMTEVGKAMVGKAPKRVAFVFGGK